VLTEPWGIEVTTKANEDKYLPGSHKRGPLASAVERYLMHVARREESRSSSPTGIEVAALSLYTSTYEYAGERGMLHIDAYPSPVIAFAVLMLFPSSDFLSVGGALIKNCTKSSLATRTPTTDRPILARPVTLNIQEISNVASSSKVCVAVAVAHIPSRGNGQKRFDYSRNIRVLLLWSFDPAASRGGLRTDH